MTIIIVGRFVFFALMVMQCFFLASYPAYYEDEDAWYAVSLLFAPSLMMWWWINSIDAAKFDHVLAFWMVYIWLGVVPLIGIVFGRTGDKIESKGFWNANTLKLTLSVTPLLYFLIRHTRIASRDHDVHLGQINEVSAKAMMNFFDGIELLAVILDENDCSHGIPMHYKNTLIAFTCISFLWWPVGMFIDDEAARIDEQDSANWAGFVHLCSYPIQVLFDTIFLGLRLGLCFGYGKNLSIFINKNIIIIFVFSWRIFNYCYDSDDSNNNSTATQQQDESREPTTSTTTTIPVLPANTGRAGNNRVAPLTIAPPPYDELPPPYTPNV
ncbi:uncharacterized protein LOC144657933 [Oculina patagonica]